MFPILFPMFSEFMLAVFLRLQTFLLLDIAAENRALGGGEGAEEAQFYFQFYFKRDFN